MGSGWRILGFTGEVGCRGLMERDWVVGVGWKKRVRFEC